MIPRNTRYDCEYGEGRSATVPINLSYPILSFFLKITGVLFRPVFTPPQSESEFIHSRNNPKSSQPRQPVDLFQNPRPIHTESSVLSPTSVRICAPIGLDALMGESVARANATTVENDPPMQQNENKQRKNLPPLCVYSSAVLCNREGQATKRTIWY